MILILLLTPFAIIKGDIPADISFITIDFKYNATDGVKICEAQQGLMSLFWGWDQLHRKKNKGINTVISILDQHQKEFFFVESGLAKCYQSLFKSNARADKHWHGHTTWENLLNDKSFRSLASSKPKNPHHLSDYRCIVLAHCKEVEDLNQFRLKYPGALLIDSLFQPHCGKMFATDKFLMSSLFSGPEALERLKPQWGLYQKEDSQEVVDQILGDFASELLVIKPRNACFGSGVIILRRDDLAQTLHTIFSEDELLSKNPDISYSYWASDNNEDFLVEEFIWSDLKPAPAIGGGHFDPTFRAVILLFYNLQQIKIQIPIVFAIMPKISIEAEGTLMQKHKSYGHNQPAQYQFLDPFDRAEIENQLRTGFTLMYENLLSE